MDQKRALELFTVFMWLHARVLNISQALTSRFKTSKNASRLFQTITEAYSPSLSAISLFSRSSIRCAHKFGFISINACSSQPSFGLKRIQFTILADKTLLIRALCHFTIKCTVEHQVILIAAESSLYCARMSIVLKII